MVKDDNLPGQGSKARDLAGYFLPITADGMGGLRAEVAELPAGREDHSHTGLGVAIAE